jgi:hypothetical protein
MVSMNGIIKIQIVLVTNIGILVILITGRQEQHLDGMLKFSCARLEYIRS